MATPEIRVVYLQFGSEHFQDGYGHLVGLLNEWFPENPRRICVVDNSLEGDFEISLNSDTDLVSGDNTARDFSGYDRGIRWLNSACASRRRLIWVFANDTFHRDLGVATSRYFTKTVVRFGLEKRAFVGFEDSYPKTVEIFGLKLRRWMRTNFFILPGDVVDRVYPLTMQFIDSEVFGGTPNSFFRRPSPLSENYRNYLCTWLFGKRDPRREFRFVWRSAERLTRENLTDFQIKAKAILSEHYLSARIQALGTKIFPVNNPRLSAFVSNKSDSTTQTWLNRGANSKDAGHQRSRHSSE